jgi:hypothetical protein
VKALLVALALLFVVCAPAHALTSAEIDAAWNYDDPVASEQRFRAEARALADGSPEALEIDTQIARTLGLQGRFDDAERAARYGLGVVVGRPPRVDVRFLLERGRVANSSGAPSRRRSGSCTRSTARRTTARPSRVLPDRRAAHARDRRAAGERMAWNAKALAAADTATEPRARGWRASLLNNLGWSLLDQGNAPAALYHVAAGARRARGVRRAWLDPHRAVDRRARVARYRQARRGRAHPTRARRRIRARRRARSRGLRRARRDRAGAKRRICRRRVDREGQGREVEMNDTKRAAIFERLREANPAPTTELEHVTPFELLVAVVLSAQSTDKGVNKATAKLYPVANTPAAIAKLGIDGLTPYIASLGLFRNKAKAVVGLSEILVREHGGEVPRDRAKLEALPGVGRKTANVS